MTINVIRKGRLTCVCSRCKSELGYDYGDHIVKRANTDYLGDYDLIRVIVCPICKYDIPIPENII